MELDGELSCHQVAHLMVFQRSPIWALPQCQEYSTAESEANDRLSYRQHSEKMSHTPTGLNVVQQNRRTFDHTTQQCRETFEAL